MGLFDRFLKKEPKEQPIKMSAQKPKRAQRVEFSASPNEVRKALETPKIVKGTGKQWMSWGIDNKYPEILKNLAQLSPLHSGIVNARARLSSGRRLLFNSLPYNEWKSTASQEEILTVDFFLNTMEDPEELKSKLAYDYVVSGSFYLEIRWSLDFSRIAKISYIPWFNVRPQEEDEEGNINYYWYSKRWNDEFGERKIEPVQVQAFTPEAQLEGGEIPEDHPYEYTQILAVKRTTSQQYFGEPTYISAIDDIYTDAILQNYLLNTSRDGFTPSVVVKVPDKPGSEEEERLLAREIEKEFSILGNAKKVLVTFESMSGKYAEIEPIKVENFDTSVKALKEIVVQDILTAHSMTSPEIAGVPIPGRMGTGDLSTQWNIFYNNTILPDRMPIERCFNQLLKINGGETLITFETIKTYE